MTAYGLKMASHKDTPVRKGTHTDIFGKLHNSYMLRLRSNKTSAIFDFQKPFIVLIAEGVEKGDNNTLARNLSIFGLDNV